MFTKRNFSSLIIINDRTNKEIGTMEFALYARFYDVSSDWRTIMDYTSAIDLRYDENTLSGVFDMILNSNIANRLPKTKSPLDNFFISLRCNVSDIDSIINDFSDLLVKKNPEEGINRYHVLSVLEALKTINSSKIDDEKDKCVIFDIYDSVVGSSYIGLEFPSNAVGFKAHSLAEKISREDVQISFTEKLDVAYTSFGTIPNMVCFADYIFTPTPGSYMTITNESMTMNYVGTEFSSQNITNYAHKRITMKLTFVPENGKIYKNSDEYEKFKEFVEYLESGSSSDPMKRMMKLAFKLSSIELSVAGEDKSETVSTFSEKLMSALSKELGHDISKYILADNPGADDTDKILVFDHEKLPTVLLRPLFN